MNEATPTKRERKLIAGGFSTLIEALEYAAECGTGFNFYSAKGDLIEALTYKKMQKKAVSLAYHLVSQTEPDDRVGFVQ